MAERQLPESFTIALTGCQDRLYAYIMALVLDPHEADDVLQETNAVLCRETDRMPTIEDFVGWACRIAYFQVLTRRKQRGRDRHIFDDRLLELVAEEAVPVAAKASRYKAALHDCLAELSPAQRALVVKRYGGENSPAQIAAELGRPLASLHQTLYRIRTALLKCIQRKVVQEERV